MTQRNTTTNTQESRRSQAAAEVQEAPNKHAAHIAVGVASTLAGGIAWGFSGTCVQYLFASTTMDPLLLTTYRQLGAGLVFLAVLLVRERALLHQIWADRQSVRRLLIFGSAGLFLNSTVYAATVAATNAGTATVLQSLNIVIVLGIACLCGRRLPRRLEVAALACALAAVFFIATHGDPTTIVMPLDGLAFGLATACAASFYTSYPKPLFERWGSFATTGIGMFVGGVTGLIACAITGEFAGGLPALDGTAALVMAIAILVGTFAAYGLFLHGVSIVGPVWGNMLGAIEPVSATVISALWLATAFSWADWIGLALMVATIVLVALEAREA